MEIASAQKKRGVSSPGSPNKERRLTLIRELQFSGRTVARCLLWILNGVGDPQPLEGSTSQPTTFQNETGLAPALAGTKHLGCGRRSELCSLLAKQAIGWANRECHRSYCLIKTLTGLNDHS